MPLSNKPVRSHLVVDMQLHTAMKMIEVGTRNAELAYKASPHLEDQQLLRTIGADMITAEFTLHSILLALSAIFSCLHTSTGSELSEEEDILQRNQLLAAFDESVDQTRKRIIKNFDRKL